METMTYIFLPDPENILLATLCYIATILCAYQRYRLLAAQENTFIAPDAARLWTTPFRYHLSAVAYIGVL